MEHQLLQNHKQIRGDNSGSNIWPLAQGRVSFILRFEQYYESESDSLFGTKCYNFFFSKSWLQDL
jgi:hypothetical protein